VGFLATRDLVRTGKFHYRIDIRLVLTAAQAKIILNDLVTKILRIFGWDDGN
jgi:predicted HicB family RNase H-like nuclease